MRTSGSFGLRIARISCKHSNRTGLPCSWAPLQSMTAAASRKLPLAFALIGHLAQGRSSSSSRACRVVRLRARPRGVGPALWAVLPFGVRTASRTRPVSVASFLARPRVGLVVWAVKPARRSSIHRPAPASSGATEVARLAVGAWFERVGDRGLVMRSSPAATFSAPPPELTGSWRGRRRRGRLVTVSPTPRCSAVWIRGTQREPVGTFHRVRFPSAEPARAIVAQWFTSPLPSALRVSHPLSGLIPPGPRGFVSRHIHPWDCRGLQSLSRIGQPFHLSAIVAPVPFGLTSVELRTSRSSLWPPLLCDCRLPSPRRPERSRFPSLRSPLDRTRHQPPPGSEDPAGR
jgi:hypothetical protein